MEYFNIQIAARISGVSPHTIRAWEKRYQALNPKRSANGRRLYNEKEIDRLSLLAKLSNIGNSIGQIARLKDEDLKQLLSKLSGNYQRQDNVSKLRQSSEFSYVEPETLLNNMSMAMGAGNSEIFLHELTKAEKHLSQKDYVLKVILPTFLKMKALKKENRLVLDLYQSFLSILNHGLVDNFHKKEGPGKKPFYIHLQDSREETRVKAQATSNLLQHYGFCSAIGLPLMSSTALNHTIKAYESKTIIIFHDPDKKSLAPEGAIDHIHSQIAQDVEFWIVSERSQNIQRDRNRIKLGSLSSLNAHLKQLTERGHSLASA